VLMNLSLPKVHISSLLKVLNLLQFRITIALEVFLINGALKTGLHY
jgi:hypothetical protein